MKPSTPRTLDNRPRVALEKSDTSKKNFFTHDWTDRTTWYTSAVRVVDEVAEDLGTHTTYSLDHANVIDAYHGKLFGEDSLRDAAGDSYRVVVTVDGATRTERDPHVGADGDFTVDYSAGRVTFATALAADAIVRVTYHYATDSTFIVRPDSGRLLSITFAEVQFSRDVVITDSVVFQPYGLVDAFAPHLMPGVPSGTKIPLGSPIVYKTMRDYQTDAVKAYPAYPAMGGAGWRGMAQDVIVMDWDYVSSTPLRADAGMEVRIKLQHDEPFGGTYATCSFYCSSAALEE